MNATNLTLLTLVATAALSFTTLADHTGNPTKTLIQKDKEGIALGGYDPIAYFTDGKAVKGNRTFRSTFEGATYYFASADHKAEFDTSPRRYTPAYGGYCGYAASVGKVRPANPLVWSIVDDQLIVQANKGAAGLWEKDVRASKAKADALWPRLVEAKAGLKNPVDGLFGKSILPDANRADQ